MTTTKRGPGRPPVYITEEARKAAHKASVQRAKAKSKNVSIDGDLVEALNAAADKLQETFGFRPTLSQTVRHLITKAGGVK